MRRTFLTGILLITIFTKNSLDHATANGTAKVAEEPPTREHVGSPVESDLTLSIRSETGKSIEFKPYDRELEIQAGETDPLIPHLVLKRNGVLTPGFERTLAISIDHLKVPSSGLYVDLMIETQHGDLDLERKNNLKIPVWKEKRFVPNMPSTQEGTEVRFRITFGPLTTLPHKTIETPTDYFRYLIIISNARGERLQSFAGDYAFLMENQWQVPLPEVAEATPGAAPDELLVYYYDMAPYQMNMQDPDSRLPRQNVDKFIQTALIPAMTEAFYVQTNVWGFPWYEEWHNFRSEEDPKTLSVALGEYHTWFHGQPPSVGHSMISIRVDGTLGEYDNLTDGIMSVFHHELFHNLQRNIAQHNGIHTGVSGKNESWMMFSEGTAVLASSVGQPHLQFERSVQMRSYMKRANAFIGKEGTVGGGLNQSYKEIPYQTAIYWRFLYENCGGIDNGREDPATGMQVIRKVLEIMYKGEIEQIETSTDAAQALPRIVDHALQATPSCRFRSYEESLSRFAQAIYLLRLEETRCPAAIGGFDCGFTDPQDMYDTPPADSYRIAAEALPAVRGSIPSSYGIDLIELVLDPSMRGKSIKLIFTSQDAKLSYNIQVWQTKSIDENGKIHRTSALRDEPVSASTENGSLILTFDHLENVDFDALGLIVTRTDSYEEMDTSGAYSIRFMLQ